MVCIGHRAVRIRGLGRFAVWQILAAASTTTAVCPWQSHAHPDRNAR